MKILIEKQIPHFVRNDRGRDSRVTHPFVTKVFFLRGNGGQTGRSPSFQKGSV
jgi:hypothetical protein